MAGIKNSTNCGARIYIIEENPRLSEDEMAKPYLVRALDGTKVGKRNNNGLVAIGAMGFEIREGSFTNIGRLEFLKFFLERKGINYVVNDDGLC